MTQLYGLTTKEGKMSSPALYWNYRTALASKSDCLSAAKSVMNAKGLTNIQVSAADVSGRTATVHAAIGLIKKQDPNDECNYR